MVKQKIAFLVPNLGIGGVQRVVLDIITTLNLEKYDVALFSLTEDTDILSQYKLPSHFKIYNFNIKDDDLYTFWGYFKSAYFAGKCKKKYSEVIKSIVDFNPSIIHSHLHQKDLLFGVIINKILHCKLIYTIHVSNFPKHSKGLILLAAILRPLYRQYNLIAVSKGIESEISSFRLLARKKRMMLIENKINLKKYNPIVEPSIYEEECVKVVYVARIGYPKAHEDLIKAWALLNDIKIKKELILIGPNLMGEKFVSFVKDTVNDNSVSILGSQNNIIDFLQNSDIAVFPSHQEGLPLALLEKMAMALPVIVSDITSLKNVVDDGVNGMYFKCGDFYDLADKIKYLILNKAERIRLGTNARSKVREFYGSENIAAMNEDFYIIAT